MSKPTIMQLKQLVGNHDAYAVQWDSGNGYTPVREALTNSLLHKHLNGELTIGGYVNEGDRARSLVFDIDSMDLSVVERIKAALVDLGVPAQCIGIEFSGSKGHHVWVHAATYVKSADLRRLGRAVLAATDVDCEVFPKQNVAHNLGNLVKLPGGIHRKTGKTATMLGTWPSVLPLSTFYKILEGVPEMKVGGGEAAPTLECMAAIQEGPKEGWRNHGLFHLATMLHRSSVAASNVRLVVEAANSKAEPGPLDEWEVDQLLGSADHSGPICATLPKEIQCANCPIRHTKGLYCKAGQLAHGGEGELAVVELGKRRKSGDVELRHPDLDFGLVSTKKVPPKGNR